MYSAQGRDLAHFYVDLSKSEKLSESMQPLKKNLTMPMHLQEILSLENGLICVLFKKRLALVISKNLFTYLVDR